MFDPGYYTNVELEKAEFKSLGHNVSIAKNCTIIGTKNISIGNNVRIDGFCSIIAAEEGFVELGSYIHIGCYCLLIAGAGIVMKDFSCISHGVKIFTRTDDFSGKYLTNPTVPKKYTGVTNGRVTLSKHVLVGASTVVLPNIIIGEGSSIGAQSLVTKSLDSWGVYVGSPAKRIKPRSNHLLELEKQLMEEIAHPL
ncbi:MAG: acyltransferase [Nitrospirales bacterium]|nr:acyltransferase [Nitrospirales bacterium]MDR4482073.1 acyltransferase [Nitrospirales bacterium]